MEPRERAAVMRATISDISGGLDACKDAENPCSHCERLEAYMETEIEAAEREAFEAGVKAGMKWEADMWDNCITDKPDAPTYEDWQNWQKERDDAT